MTSTELDRLMSRIVDGEASDLDWDSFRRLADADPAVWRDLALTQRDQAALRSAVERRLHAADGVLLPQPSAWTRATPALARAGAWTGWAVAATLALAAFSQSWLAPRGASPTENVAGLAPSSAADALQAYLDLGQKEGRVVGEVPQRLLVESRRAQEGVGFEVIYVRQFVERAVVPDLYRLGTDESGSATLVPTDIGRTGGGTRM